MDPKLLVAAVILVFAADLGLQLFQRKKKNDIFKKLSACISKRDFESFEKLIDDDQTKRLFPIYNRNFMKLNEAFMKDDRKAIKEAFESFSGLRMNKMQKEALYKRGFYYYLSAKDKANTKEYYDLLLELGVPDEEMIRVMYDTYIEKGYAYLERILEECGKAEGDDKMPYYALLADMYRNKGEEEKAKEYEGMIAEAGDQIWKGAA